MWIFRSGPYPEVTTCSGIYSMPTSTRSIMWEDWPLPQMSWQSHWLVSLSQYSHYIFHRLHHSRTPFPGIFTLLRVCHLFTIKDTVTVAHTGITQGNTGRPGMCFKLSEVTGKAPHSAPGLVGRWMQWRAAGPSYLVGFTALPLACQYPMDHN